MAVTQPNAAYAYGYDPMLSLNSPRSTSESMGTTDSSGVNQSTGVNASQSTSQSGSYIPDYSQTPILEQIAQWSGNMAPQVYDWGMQQYASNQGNIDQLMDLANSYASPQRQAVDMGQAEAGVMQAGAQGLKTAESDLESYGIDPSSGRYAALEAGQNVMNAASAAGAGNQQRQADVATGNAMRQQAISSSLQNEGLGYQGELAANQYAQTGMSLPYSPLGSTSSSTSTSTGQQQSTGQTASQGNNMSYSLGAPTSGTGSSGTLTSSGLPMSTGGTNNPAGSKMAAKGGTVHPHSIGYDGGGEVDPSMSPSNGAETDDVPAKIQDSGEEARLNSGEFVIPKDVAAWKGQEFFYKLMDQSRQNLAMAGQGAAKPQAPAGYNMGGAL